MVQGAGCRVQGAGCRNQGAVRCADLLPLIEIIAKSWEQPPLALGQSRLCHGGLDVVSDLRVWEEEPKIQGFMVGV